MLDRRNLEPWSQAMMLLVDGPLEQPVLGEAESWKARARMPKDRIGKCNHGVVWHGKYYQNAR